MARASKVIRFKKGGERQVLFVMEAPEANEVCVTGEFINWAKSGERLSKEGNGMWSARIGLKPGRYAYKFIVDGNWRHDPNCCECAPDGFGGENSVVEVK
ncbi:MAG: glycoside hydrolase family 13 [Candidatus Omnitrophica bacterium]|nr:glycoside hydrolase family 13 [Candidatus Omnitrophota bacterium]